MSKTIILTQKNHLFYPQIEKLGTEIIHYKKGLNITLGSSTHLLDLTCLNTQDKMEVFDSVGQEVEIYSDLTSCWGEALFHKYSNLKAAFALSFYSPTGCYEFAHKDGVSQDILNTLSSQFEIKMKKINGPGLCFNLPRVVSQIINEAYFSLEENLASANDIDTAMKFGVNYPLGPIQWAKESGLENIVSILDELHFQTKQLRYRSSIKLREDALKKEIQCLLHKIMPISFILKELPLEKLGDH